MAIAITLDPEKALASLFGADLPLVMSIPEAAKVLGKSRDWTRRQVDAGRIPCIGGEGTDRLISRQALVWYLLPDELKVRVFPQQTGNESAA